MFKTGFRYTITVKILLFKDKKKLFYKFVMCKYDNIIYSILELL